MTGRLRLKGNEDAALAIVLLIAAVLFCVLVPLAWPLDPLRGDISATFKPPMTLVGDTLHPLGTDQLGRDLLARLGLGTLVSFGIVLVAALISVVLGTALGMIAGYFGGWVDRISGRVIDTIMAFPLFVLAMGIVAAMGNTVENIIYATAIINVPFYARVARAEAAIRRHAGFVQAARLSGNSDLRILAVHVFPNALPPMAVQASLNMGWAILNAAGLSFIGLGVRPPTPEWGIMVAEGANFIVSGEWWLAIFPGLALMLTVFTFNLLGDALRDIVDPRRRT